MCGADILVLSHLGFRSKPITPKINRDLKGGGQECPPYTSGLMPTWLTRACGDIRFIGGLHQPPGFAVVLVFVAGSAGDVGMEAEALAASGSFDGDHVPGVLGDHVGDDEINFILGVNVDTSPATVSANLVNTTFDGVSGLYLHAPQAAVPGHDEVEAVAVSIGHGDSEAKTGCLVHECQFG